jgi:hypothetical protein
MDEDWGLLLQFFPANWREMAGHAGATKGLRQDKSEENLLRTILIHVGCGYSLKETVLRARKASLANLSSVALMKRLRKSAPWLRMMCLALFREQGVALRSEGGFQVRAFDATTVKEPGKTGSLWRVHYSVRLPSLTCDFFKVTRTEGRGTGESFFQFPITPNDYILADRGYSTASGIEHVVRKKAYVVVRLNTASLPLHTSQGRPFSLLNRVQGIRRTGTVKSWPVQIAGAKADINGRLCAIRKSNEAIKLAQQKAEREATKKGHKIKPETLEFAKYVLLFTTFPEFEFAANDVLDWYRLRWQVELVFKRFKSLAEFGHLPKSDSESSKAWLYGKLFVALVMEKLTNHAASISPWGYILEDRKVAEPVA